MPKRRFPRRIDEDTYLRQTQRPLHCLLFVLGPLLIYQIGALHYGTHLLAPRDLGKILRFFGATAGYLPPLLILVVLFVQHAAHRYPWKVQPLVLAGMLGESVLWLTPLYCMNYLVALVGRHLAATTAAAAAGPSLTQQALMALGAGIYEEFLFRLMLISLVMLIFVDLLDLRRDAVAVAAIAAGAVLFSLYHLTGAQLAGAAPVPHGDFIFRMLAGLYLGGLYVCRGFGIVVGTHALWNIYVALMNS